MSRIRAGMVAALIAGCGAGVDQPAVDATPGADAAAACAVLPVGASTHDLAALHGAILEEQWARGHSGANGNVSADRLYVQNLGVTLDPGAPDPGAAVLAWLEGLDAIDLVAAELAVSNAPPSWADAQGAALAIERRRVGDVAARFARPALSVFLVHEAGDWKVFSIEITPSVALATAAEAAAIDACTSDVAPADGGVLAHRFEGVRLQGCAQTGTYSYTPAAGDVVAWQTPVVWEALDDDGGWRAPPTAWRITRPATLTIAPANYWPDIGEADCLCGGQAGYELVVDTVTGAVIRYTPGLGCVVC